MKKNGFTLVELITSIVLFSIILAIVVPSASSVMKNSKVNTFKIATEELVEAVDLAIYSDNLLVESLNSMSVNEIFSYLGINELDSTKFQSIKFLCAGEYENTCTEYTVFAIGNGKYKDVVSSGYNNNISSADYNSEIGISMKYLNDFNNYLKLSPLSDGNYTIRLFTDVPYDLRITGGGIEVRNNKILTYFIIFDDKTVTYNQEKRLPVIE